jgi:hypothetical protein
MPANIYSCLGTTRALANRICLPVFTRLTAFAFAALSLSLSLSLLSKVAIIFFAIGIPFVIIGKTIVAESDKVREHPPCIHTIIIK